jgi:hypothetical protein
MSISIEIGKIEFIDLKNPKKIISKLLEFWRIVEVQESWFLNKMERGSLNMELFWPNSSLLKSEEQ